MPVESSIIQSPPPNIDLLLGPLLIAIIFNAFVYGICFLQFTTYWTSKWNDSYLIKLLVGWTFLLDTFHTAALIYMLWVYVVDNLLNPSFLWTVLWPFSTTPIVTTMTSFPIQVYLSWRVKQFANSRLVFFYLMLLATAQASLGITCSIAAYQVPDIIEYHELIPFVDAWEILAVAADGSITILLWYYLSRSRTGLKRFDNVITRLILSSVETAAIGAFFCIMDLITFTALQRTNFHVIFAFPMGRIYTNTLLMNLNKRKALRTQLERTQIPDIVFDQTVRLILL
ncbi:hypothetical protein BYT27DRAFT_7095594 [Phlegmacium glaucopus]|nr:hypothetical protein BYT27DRAFT_7095594 [Phlegmacium glaucopus]